MTRKAFEFSVTDADGEILKTFSRRCYRASAPNLASRILTRVPCAAAVYAFEKRGAAVFSAYRTA